MTIPAAIAAVHSETREWEDRSWFPPGPQLAICLPDGDGLASLTDAELVEVMAAARRQTAWAQARELAAIAELSRRRHQEDENGDDGDDGYRVLSAHESLLEEVAAALTVTGNTAATLVHLADRLATALPGTRAALETGRIDLPKARVICDAVDRLADDVAGRVEAVVLEQASVQTTGQLRRRAKRAVQRLVPGHFEDRKRDVVAGRRLEVWESVHGTAGLGLLDVPADDARAIHNKITAVARAVRGDGDQRALDQIRADLATELLRGNSLPDAVQNLLSKATPPSQVAPGTASGEHRRAADSGAGNGGPGARAERNTDTGVAEVLALVVDQRLNQVLDQARATGRMHALPALTAQTVQHLRDRLADIRDTWCQVTQTDGVEGHGEQRYRPSAGLRRMIEERHPTCVFPSCNIRSDQCDLDHTVPYHAHGTTCGCNLAPLCRRHHRTKVTRGWRLFQIWPGLLVWITPSGTWHIVPPARE